LCLLPILKSLLVHDEASRGSHSYEEVVTRLWDDEGIHEKLLLDTGDRPAYYGVGSQSHKGGVVVQKRVNTPSEREAKRQHILAVAAHEFALYGFDVANINVIAEKAGVGKGTMYRYAKDKEDLFLQVLEEAAKRVKAAIDQVFEESAGQGVRELIRSLVARLQTLGSQYPDFITLQNSALYGIVHRRYRDIAATALQYMAVQVEVILSRELLLGHIRPVDAGRMARFITWQFNTLGQVNNILIGPGGDPGEFMADVFWRGLKPD
jgi:AcrR family transcriptional regulator